MGTNTRDFDYVSHLSGQQLLQRRPVGFYLGHRVGRWSGTWQPCSVSSSLAWTCSQGAFLAQESRIPMWSKMWPNTYVASASVQFSSVQSLGCARLCDSMDCSTPGLPVHHQLLSIESVMPSNHLILCIPFSSHLQTFPASGTFQMSQFFASGGQSI